MINFIVKKREEEIILRANDYLNVDSGLMNTELIRTRRIINAEFVGVNKK